MRRLNIHILESERDAVEERMADIRKSLAALAERALSEPRHEFDREKQIRQNALAALTDCEGALTRAICRESDAVALIRELGDAIEEPARPAVSVPPLPETGTVPNVENVPNAGEPQGVGIVMHSCRPDNSR